VVDFALETEIDGIEAVEPDVPGDFISTLPPNALLLIEGWLVRGKIFKMNLGMTLKKEHDLLTLVPIGSIHIEVDGVASECPDHMLQNLQESLPVSPGCTYESLSAQKWSHPSRQIEPLPMLAGGRNSEAFASLGPASSEAGMEAETSLILKHERFIGFELGEFFLTPDEIGLHPRHVPVDKHSQPFSDCSPTDASNIEPVAFSASLQNLSSDEPAGSAHPRQVFADRTPGVIFPDPAAALVSTPASVDLAGLAGVWIPEPESLPDSHRVSIVPESCGSDPGKHSLVPDAGPPTPAAGQRSSTLPMPLGPASPSPAAFLCLPRGEPTLMLSCTQYSMICSLIQH